MELVKAFPRTSMDNGVDIPIINASNTSYLPLSVRTGIVKSNNLAYYVFAILIKAIGFAVLGLAQRLISMSLILKWRNPFKIIHMVIMLIAIPVVRLMLVSRRSADKGYQYGAMGVDLRRSVVPAETKGKVLSLPTTSFWLNDFADTRSLPGNHSSATTFVTDLINTFPTGNVFPNFTSHEKISYGKPQEIEYTSLATRRLLGLSSGLGMLIALPGLSYVLNYTIGDRYGNVD